MCYRCPNYSPVKASAYCSVCNDGIYPGDKYIRNFDDELVHYDCIGLLSTRKLLNWLDVEVLTMGDKNENDWSD
jgi:hypothetical protein